MHILYKNIANLLFFYYNIFMDKKLTIKDSSLAFLVGFLLSQFGVVCITILTMCFFTAAGFNLDNASTFFNTAIGYTISALGLYVVMLLVFFFFKKRTTDKITKPIKVKRLLFYILIAVASFICLYPIIVCVDSFLIKCGIQLGSIAFPLTTKNYFIALIPMVIAPAVCEELLFRGIIFSGLKRYGKVFSIVVSALMFCIFHMSIGQTAYPILMGLLLGVIMFYEQNIYYCIAVHLTNNFLSLTLSYFKINLVFNHWTYALLAIILFIVFITTILIFTFKNFKSHRKEIIKRNDIYLLIAVLSVMLLIWIAVNFI